MQLVANISLEFEVLFVFFYITDSQYYYKLEFNIEFLKSECFYRVFLSNLLMKLVTGRKIFFSRK